MSRSEVDEGRSNEGKDRPSCEQYIDHAISFMKICRMWKSADVAESRWDFAKTIFTGMLMSSALILGLTELIELKNGSILSSLDKNCGMFWLHLVAFYKWFRFAWRVDVVMHLLRLLDKCYNLSLQISDSVRDLARLDREMQRARRGSRLFLRAWCGLVTCGVTDWCVYPIILNMFGEDLQTTVTSNGTKIHSSGGFLPFAAWVPWNSVESSGYLLTYAFHVIGHVSSGIGTVSFDVLYVTLVMMMHAQLRYLNYSLSNWNETSQLKRTKMSTSQYLQKKLRICRLHHDAVLRFIANVDRVSSPLIFGQCIGTMGIVCVVAFKAMTTDVIGDVNNILQSVCLLEYLLGAFGLLFVFCYNASEMTILGLEVADSAWKCGWESILGDTKSAGHQKTTINFQNISFMMREITQRAQKPIRLSGGPFYVLSLDSFRRVIGVAFSYSTVMREMNSR